MKFQHTTSLAIQPGIQRKTQSGGSGQTITIIPGQDALFTVTIQQLMITWTGVTTAGQVNIVGMPADPNPFVIYQTAGNGSVVIPFYDEVYQLGTYGLRATNNSTGGSYIVTAFYTQILP